MAVEMPGSLLKSARRGLAGVFAEKYRRVAKVKLYFE